MTAKNIDSEEDEREVLTDDEPKEEPFVEEDEATGGTKAGNVHLALWEFLVRKARKKLQDAGYPIPQKPTASVNQLSVPTDVEGLGAIPLANLLLQYQGWYAYSTAQLAFARSDMAAFDEFYEVQLGQKMHSIASNSDGRPVKDILKALAVKDDPLRSLMIKKVELSQRVQMIDGLVQSLAIQCRALTNEQIRRHAAQKLDSKEF